TNEYLAEHGIAERIDHRSHKDRGLDTLPTVKMGWQATELERKGIRTDVGDKNRDIKAYNANLMQQKILASEIVIQRTLKNAS
ncbi:MobA/MobL family protein, partial [Rhizobium ruizarguesonis]